MNAVSIVKWVLLLNAVIILHDGFHAWVAASLGIPIRMVFIGLPIGPYLTLRVRNIPVRVYLLPLGGGIAMDINDFWRAPFWKKVLVLIYGPIGSLIGALMVAVAFFGSWGITVVQMVLDGVTYSAEILLAGKLFTTGLPVTPDVIANTAQLFEIGPIKGVILAWLFLNVSVAVLNLMPIPGLDGGTLLLGALSGLAGNSPIAVKTAHRISHYGMLCLFGGVLLLTVRDVIRTFF